ncbi:MAG TPA: L,D-transpeptidase [Candidatus Bathyarchaeia archaeon]|nr:L,D-transpeptidase [Candidatus Bathyarchaeia archaeon]
MKPSRFFIIFLPLAGLIGLAVLAISVGRPYLLKQELESEKLIETIKTASGDFKPEDLSAVFLNKKVASLESELFPSQESLTLGEKQQVLSAVDGEEKWIEIDLSDQRIYAHEGERIVYEFLTSTGKWAPTPTGTFRIWTKLRYAKMSGGSRAMGTYYYLPNVPYIMYFYKGYGIHGAYWHNNFGTPMSHGCVNLAIPDAEKLFYWAGPSLSEGKNVAYPTKDDPGTLVVVHE